MQSENISGGWLRKAANIIRVGYISVRIFGYNVAEKFNGKSRTKNTDSAFKDMPADRLYRLLEFSRKKNSLLEEKLKILSLNKPKVHNENPITKLV